VHPVFEGKSPLTQSAEAVKQLIEFVSGMPCNELPATFALSNGAQLTKSSKGDVFYVTTPKACSCPGFTYRGSCKHVTALKSGTSRSQAQAYQARQRELRAKAKAGGSLPEPTGPARRLARPPEDDLLAGLNPSIEHWGDDGWGPNLNQKKQEEWNREHPKKDSIKPAGKWPGGMNGPVNEIPGAA
jgi:hypothetical protein